MPKLFFIIASLFSLSSLTAWAETNPAPVYENSFANMTYPSVSGNYLVYSQQVRKTSQIMRVQVNNLYGAAQDSSILQDDEVLKNGVALRNGSFAYVSNRLGYISPWVSNNALETKLDSGLFNSSIIPNHLDASANASVWVFDTTLELSRTPRIIKQFNNTELPHELVGQNWRMYHEKLWSKKSGYPDTESGVSNGFAQPHIFTFKNNSSDLNMLGDGFDASLSADGSWMVFVRETDGNFDLWKQNIDGTGLQRLTKSTYADVEPALNTDGTQVTFVSNRDAGGDVLQTNIYTLNIATSSVTRLTSGTDVTDGGPDWLDNHTVVFHSNRDPQSPSDTTVDNWRLWKVSVEKQKLK
ncbi:MAG: hypothetical protein R8M14_09640 [Ghiorsea sp.]